MITKFIRVGGESLASKKGTTQYFYHNDHLGGVNVVTDIAGTRVQLIEYDPWGAVSRSEGTINPDTRFTGQKLDPETGLYYYGGRYYDAETGRFVSADPFVQTPYDPQNLNRYSYVINNPQNYIDPDGYFHRHKKKSGGFWNSIFGSIFRIFLNIAFLAAGLPPGLDFAAGLGSAFAIADLAHATSNLARLDSSNGGITGGSGPQFPGLSNISGGGFFSPALQMAMTAGCDVCSDAGWDLLRLLGGLLQPNNAQAGDGKDGVTFPPNPSLIPLFNIPGLPPRVIYRAGKPSPSNLKPRPGEEYLSFRDSVSNPLPKGERPVFRPGDDYFALDVSKLPPGSVFNPRDVPGHIGVRNVPPDVLQKAVIERGRFPK